MAGPQTLDLLGGQIDVDQVAGALSAIIPQQQAEALPAAEAEPVQMASAEMPVEPASIEPAVAEEPAAVEPAPVEPASIEPAVAEEPAAVEPAPVEPAPVATPQKETIFFDGQPVTVQSNMTEEQRLQVIELYMKSPAYAAKKAQADKSWERENIDSESGAPGLVRAMVGPSGELSEDDRLATLRSYYPDAVPYGEDNFLFFDEGLGKFTLFNPLGLDVGDAAEYLKAVFETVGGTLGGLGGTYIGGPGPGTYGGIIAGTEFTARAFNTLTGVFAGRVRTPKTIAGEFAESGTRAALTIGGEVVGRGVAEAGKRALTGVSPKVRNAASDLIAKFESLGIEPVGAAIGRTGMLGRMFAGLEQMVGADHIMRRQAEKVIVQLNSALQSISSKMGQVRTPNEAGAALKSSVEAAEKRIRDGFSKKYDEVFDEIGADTLVTEMPSVNTILQPFLKEIAELPADAQPAGQILALVKKYDALSKFAEAGNYTFKQLRNLRTQLRLIRSKKTSDTQGDYDGLVEDLYRAVTDDISATANSVRPDLGGKLKAIDTERAIFADTAQKTFDKIRKFDADNQAFNHIMISAKGLGKEGINALQRLRQNFTPDEWGDVAASVLYDLGRENAGSQVGDVAKFSVETFMQRISAIKQNGPEAFEALFGGTQFDEVSKELMNLVDVVGALKEVKRFTGVSNSAGVMNQMAFWGSLVEIGKKVVGGRIAAAGGILVTSIGAPVFAAKVMTNPNFIKWLSTPADEISKDVTAHMGRLAALSVSEPEIQEELRQYYSAIRSYTGYNEPANEGTAK
jgi:hypothetical protein